MVVAAATAAAANTLFLFNWPFIFVYIFPNVRTRRILPVAGVRLGVCV